MEICYFVKLLVIYGLFNIVSLKADVVNTADIISENAKGSLDVNQINSSEDMGSFYSIDVSIKQMEDNIVKMAYELKKLKQQIDFAKKMERKNITEIQKLEKSRFNFDKSCTESSTKIENVDNQQQFLNNNTISNKLTGTDSTNVKQEIVVEVIRNT